MNVYADVVTPYSIPEVWDQCMWMLGSFCCYTAVVCHQCYLLQLMKRLMMLMWLLGTHILPVIPLLLSVNLQGWYGQDVIREKWRSITFLMTYWCVSILIFLFVALCLAASVINLFVRLHHKGM
jgi:hypothetical protein